jgi:hypothetical protein
MLLYKVVRKDEGSNFITPGTLLQPMIGDVFYGERVNKNLCILTTQEQSCYTQTVVMGIATVPVSNTQVEFYFPVNYVRACVNIGGNFITIRTLLVGAAILFVGYKLIKRK